MVSPMGIETEWSGVLSFLKMNQRDERIPEISRFFGIIIRMSFEDHNPLHVHVEYQGEKALFDFNGNILRGRISSKIAVKLVRE